MFISAATIGYTEALSDPADCRRRWKDCGTFGIALL